GVQGLYGWGFNGGPRWTLGFETPMELAELCQALLELSDAPAFGLVLLGESDGLCGLNLRRSPVECGDQAVSLFEADQFPQWLDFPVEPEELHARVAAVGFIHREPVSPAWRDSLPARTPFHVHGLVCTKGSLSRDPALFRSELERLVQTTEPRKVQHLLGQSRFKAGLVAVTELKLEAAAAHL
ncbi:MAG TPA: hypothetical protein VN436_12100, partial [Holophaga sp.]|nr:hypothetical protein [Holophaga sp.]